MNRNILSFKKATVVPWYKSSQSKLSSPGQLLCKLYCISKRKPLKLKSLINISLANFSIRSCVQPEKPDCVKWDTSRYLRMASTDRLKLAWKGYWTIQLYIHHFIFMFSRYITNQFSNSQLACYNCSSIVRALQHWYHSVQGSTPGKPEFFQAFFRTCIARLTVIIFSAFFSISEYFGKGIK